MPFVSRCQDFKHGRICSSNFTLVVFVWTSADYFNTELPSYFIAQIKLNFSINKVGLCYTFYVMISNVSLQS